MPASINTYLKNLSYSFYLKKNSEEIKKIDASIKHILANLNKELGLLTNRIFVFGSYSRDTILPRSIDAKSDIDIMVVFNHTAYERTPETYRLWLKNFGDKYYKNRYGSEVIKSFPTVTIKLGNIHYDLVPAKEEMFCYSKILYIPSAYGWQTTDPNDVKVKLTEANTTYNQIVRPIVRLMKAWNCSNGYPFDSYELELFIINLNFFGDNVQEGFFYAVNQIILKSNDSITKRNKVKSLQYNIAKVKDYLEKYDEISAKYWLHKVLPKP